MSRRLFTMWYLQTSSLVNLNEDRANCTAYEQDIKAYLRSIHKLLLPLTQKTSTSLHSNSSPGNCLFSWPIAQGQGAFAIVQRGE